MLKLKSISLPSKLSEVAYMAIKESILASDAFDFENGGRVDEKMLAEQLGISRTPVREAVNRLVFEGFLRVVPRQGIYVATKSKEEIIEILRVRSVLEGLAARFTSIHATKEDIVMMRGMFAPFYDTDLSHRAREYSEANIKFHEFVLERSQCKKLIEIAGNLFDQMRVIRIQAGGYPDRPRISLSQHLEIIEAFEKKQADEAERLMRSHIEEVIDAVEEHLISFDA
ncbi:MAG: GntR family transcriptional regulator [Deltaproteobacteria bacterium]|nr:GntR family transcriptional regulator [Deltaproteobacteria bacterium]MBW2065184.1 GntR family transcriptional regulator [Deltaproteobacteria bacterium]